VARALPPAGDGDFAHSDITFGRWAKVCQMLYMASAQDRHPGERADFSACFCASLMQNMAPSCRSPSLFAVAMES